MAAAPLQRHETRTHVASASVALLTLFVDGLPNSVVLQLAALPAGKRRALSLYVLYRQGTVTFDAVTRFPDEVGDQPLAGALQRFVDTDAFQSVVVTPLVRDVAEHFRRRERAPLKDRRPRGKPAT